MTNQMNQLLSKALSTNSEEEAMACLRMARKKANGQTVNLGGSNKTETNKDWKDLANKYCRIAKERDAKMNKYHASALYYRSEMREARAQLAALKNKKTKLPFGLQKETLFLAIMAAIMVLTFVLMLITILL